jgi:hypothetical protein
MGPFAKRQMGYIRAERRRMEKLTKAWRRYQTAARELGLHPLNPDEINARKRELDQMAAEAEAPDYEARQAALAKLMASV